MNKPLIKRNGRSVEAGCDEALDLAAGRMEGIKARHGSDATGDLASAKYINEGNKVELCR